MELSDLVTFLSDFGWGGGYVAACEALITSVNPHARVLHISHDIRVGEVREGGMILARTLVYCLPGVHLAVVDPGVGTGRRILVLATRRGDYLLGPDNGLLLPAAEALGGVESAWSLDPSSVRARAGLPPSAISHTFHARDIFAPAAALVSAHVQPSDLGSRVAESELTKVRPFVLEKDEGSVRAEVIEVDRFGNVALALPFHELPDGASFGIEIEGEEQSPWYARVIWTYGELRSGELGLLRDSWGQATLVLNSASAAELLGVRQSAIVRLRSTR